MSGIFKMIKNSIFLSLMLILVGLFISGCNFLIEEQKNKGIQAFLKMKKFDLAALETARLG